MFPEQHEDRAISNMGAWDKTREDAGRALTKSRVYFWIFKIVTMGSSDYVQDHWGLINSLVRDDICLIEESMQITFVVPACMLPTYYIWDKVAFQWAGGERVTTSYHLAI